MMENEAEVRKKWAGFYIVLAEKKGMDEGCAIAVRKELHFAKGKVDKWQGGIANGGG